MSLIIQISQYCRKVEIGGFLKTKEFVRSLDSMGEGHLLAFREKENDQHWER